MQPTPGRFSNMVASPTLCLSRFFSPSPSGAADKTSFFTLIFLLCIWTFIHVLADKYFPRRGYENGVISVFIANACDMLKLTVRPWLFCRCKDVNAGFLSPGSLRLPLRLCVKSKDCRFSIQKKKKKVLRVFSVQWRFHFQSNSRMKHRLGGYFDVWNGEVAHFCDDIKYISKFSCGVYISLSETVPL